MGENFEKLGELKEAVGFLARKAFSEKTKLDGNVIAVSGPSKERDELDALKEQFATDPEKLAEAEGLARSTLLAGRYYKHRRFKSSDFER